MPKGKGRPFSKDIRNLSDYLHGSVNDGGMSDSEASKTVLGVDDQKTKRRDQGLNDARTSINKTRRLNITKSQVTPGDWKSKSCIDGKMP